MNDLQHGFKYGIKTHTTYLTLDGSEHRTIEQAEAHAIERLARSEKRLEDFKKTDSYKKLTARYNLDAEGVWEVRGEDPNCDLGGPHHEPYLGTFSGKLRTCIEMAVGLDGFWQWGWGGSITKIDIKDLP